jgi:predicted anti-sigma-YlaC factor YlaD
MGQLAMDCRLAREQVSLRLDGELSDFEDAALSSHLAACAACRSYAFSTTEATAQIRATPLEQPEYPVVLPHRTRVRIPLRTAHAAAAAAVIAIIGFTAAGVSPSTERSISLGAGAGNTLADRSPNLSPQRVARATVDFRFTQFAPRAVRGRIIAL